MGSCSNEYTTKELEDTVFSIRPVSDQLRYNKSDAYPERQTPYLVEEETPYQSSDQ